MSIEEDGVKRQNKCVSLCNRVPLHQLRSRRDVGKTYILVVEQGLFFRERLMFTFETGSPEF